MQKFNYSEKIELENKINELIMINIDDKLEQTSEIDCIKVFGEIKISGEANTVVGNKKFDHGIMVDIMLSRDQLIQDNVNISIEDFDYKIEDSSILINLIMKIDGLKEIEPYFPAQENQEDIKIEEIEETQEDNLEEFDNAIKENEEVEIPSQENRLNETEITPVFQESTSLVKEEPLNDLELKKEKFSLLEQVFKNRTVKKEISYSLHVVKTETTYQQIADLYNIDINKLKKANNDEEIYIGKLVFIPKQ